MLKYKLLWKSIFDWHHFVTGAKFEVVNFCIYCGKDFSRTEPCFNGNIFTRLRDAILFIIYDKLS